MIRLLVFACAILACLCLGCGSDGPADDGGCKGGCCRPGKKCECTPGNVKCFCSCCPARGGKGPCPCDRRTDPGA